MSDTREKVRSWWTKNILMSGKQEFEKPGYVLEKINESSQPDYIRDVLLPESFFSELETEVSDKKGEELYRSGKEFGYQYSALMDLPQLQDPGSPSKRFKTMVYFLVRFIEGSYAGSIDYETDLEKKSFWMKMDDYVVCRKSGVGLLFSTGGVAGIWSYMMNDSSIEAVQTTCQGRGDEICRVKAMPRAEIESSTHDVEVSAEEIDLSSSYWEMNRPRELRFSDTSLRDLLDVGFFDYPGGKIVHGSEGFVFVLPKLVYMLEDRIDDEVMFEKAFDSGARLAEGETERELASFLSSYLAGTGWGDTRIKSRDPWKVESNLFPWTSEVTETSLPVFRGLVSGLISGFCDQRVELALEEKDERTEGFTVKLSG
jgi:predicted hydrocarbon binding protein